MIVLTNIFLSSMSEYKRKLASVQLIDEISEHDNADTLEIAKVLGWQVVVKKNTHKKGDKVVFFEIDSVLPRCSWSESFAIQVKSRGGENIVVNSIKLRGKLSQGLVIRLSALVSDESIYNVGDDLTQMLGVKKEDSEEIKVGDDMKLLPFPNHLGFIKTDEPRIQAEPEMLASFKGKKWYATVKYDGTSATFFINPNKDELVVCSRNNQISRPANISKSKSFYWNTAEQYKIYDILSKYSNLVLQGEIYGPGVQNNKLDVTKLSFAIFSIYDLNCKKYCNFHELQKYCKLLNLDMVEIDSFGDSFNFTSEQLLVLAKGTYPGNLKNKKLLHPNNPQKSHIREGLVFRLQDGLYSDNYGSNRASFKVINNDYLLKSSK